MGPPSADLVALHVLAQRTLDDEAGEHLGPVVPDHRHPVREQEGQLNGIFQAHSLQGRREALPRTCQTPRAWWRPMTALSLESPVTAHLEAYPSRRPGALPRAVRPVNPRAAALHAYATSQLGAELISRAQRAG